MRTSPDHSAYGLNRWRVVVILGPCVFPFLELALNRRMEYTLGPVR